MAKKLLLGAIIGGVILFVWGAVSHMLLPFATMGLQRFTDEEAVKQTVVANAPGSGVYFLPYMPQEGLTEEQQNAAFERAMQGPVLFVSVRLGRAASFGSLLGIQFVIDVLTALLLTALLLNVRPMRYAKRVLFVIGVALVVGIAAHLPDWNWYNFSLTYTAGEFFSLLIGFALAGLVLARIAKPQSTTAAAST
jgi:hypothetical protein